MPRNSPARAAGREEPHRVALVRTERIQLGVRVLLRHVANDEAVQVFAVLRDDRHVQADMPVLGKEIRGTLRQVGAIGRLVLMRFIDHDQVVLLHVRKRDCAVVIRVAHAPLNHLFIAHGVRQLTHLFLGHG